ncbi:MAG: hypothetical protein WDM91_18275 [Rhizomicrobium sp.]
MTSKLIRHGTGTARPRPATKHSPDNDLLARLQAMLYEFHAMGRFEDARPHLLRLMEIAEGAPLAAAPSGRPS